MEEGRELVEGSTDLGISLSRQQDKPVWGQEERAVVRPSELALVLGSLSCDYDTDTGRSLSQ